MIPVFLIGVPLADANAVLGAVFLTSGLIAVTLVVPGFWMSGAGRGSPGKRALGIAVVGSDGRPIGFARGIKRQFVLLVGSVVLYIGWLSALWNPKRQAWHDKAAHSLVVRRAATAQPASQANTELPAAPATTCPVCGFALGPDGRCKVCGATA
jgi:uncharacterized RDD family membrane protein YckC